MPAWFGDIEEYVHNIYIYVIYMMYIYYIYIYDIYIYIHIYTVDIDIFTYY